MRLSTAALVAAVGAYRVPLGPSGTKPGSSRADCSEYSGYQNDPVGFLRYWNDEAAEIFFDVNVASWEQGMGYSVYFVDRT